MRTPPDPGARKRPLAKGAPRNRMRHAIVHRGPHTLGAFVGEQAGAAGGQSCPPNCALACPTASWAYLLVDGPTGAPPSERLGWALHGMPDPLPRTDWRDAFAAVAGRFGPATVVAGLRFAASIPTTGRQPWSAAELQALAERLEQRLRRAAR